jgi:hypothetical protein
LFRKHNSFWRPLKKEGFKEERVTTMGLYDLGKSHDPGIQQEPPLKRTRGFIADQWWRKGWYMDKVELIRYPNQVQNLLGWRQERGKDDAKTVPLPVRW